MIIRGNGSENIMNLLHGTSHLVSVISGIQFTDPFLSSFYPADLALATTFLFLSHSQMGLSHVITIFCFSSVFSVIHIFIRSIITIITPLEE